MELCDDNGPSNINVLGGAMPAGKIDTRMASPGGRITIAGGIVRIERQRTCVENYLATGAGSPNQRYR